MKLNRQPPFAALRARRRARWSRGIGVIILLAGLASAVVVYWLGTRDADLSDDPTMMGYRNPQERQLGMLYGRQGKLVEDWSNGLKQPRTQAILLVGASLLAAASCFYFASLFDADADSGAEEGKTVVKKNSAHPHVS